MQGAYDINQSLFRTKAGEGMIAFAGFKWKSPAGAPGSDGLLKIASCAKPGRDGYLTLTFILDAEDAPGQQDGFQGIFQGADQGTLADRLGPDFDMVLEVPLNPFAESSRFYLEELNLFFRRLGGRERQILVGWVMPTLAEVLDFQFEPLHWLPGGLGGDHPSGVADQAG